MLLEYSRYGNVTGIVTMIIPISILKNITRWWCMTRGFYFKTVVWFS
jgi:hypothetical protein